jgi:hypothetical protein
MSQTFTDCELIRKILPHLRRGGVIILRNSEGTMELRGDDLELKESKEWITIYHASASNSERRSHLHLRKGRYGYACVIESDGATPQIAFWSEKPEDKNNPKPAAESIKVPGIEHPAMDKNRPPFSIFFPSFYDWANNKAPIEENQRLFKEWIEKNGREFELKPEE